MYDRVTLPVALSVRAKHHERKQTTTERSAQEDQKVHQRQKKNKNTRRYTTDSRIIQRHQECRMHENWKEKNAHPESEKRKSETISSRKGTANVFGEFYSELYVEERFGDEVHDPHKSETRTNKEGESFNDEEKSRVHNR